jgi:hypothetical protein
MIKNKYYNLLSGFLDNELSAKDRLKAIKLLEENQLFKEEYTKLKQLKEITNSTKLTNPLSNNFGNNLMDKIYDYQCKESWLTKLVNRGFFTKVSYAMVSASLLFIIFLGVKVYLYEPIEVASIANDNTNSNRPRVSAVLDKPSYNPQNKNAVTTRVPYLSPFQPNQSPSTSHANNIMITVEGSNLILYIGSESIRVNIDTGQLISKIDKKKEAKFKVWLGNNGLKNILSPMRRIKRSIEQSNKK